MRQLPVSDAGERSQEAGRQERSCGVIRRRSWLVVLVALLLGASGVHGQGFSQIAFATFTTNVTLTTTAETVIVSSGPAVAPRDTINVCVLAWAQLTTGTMTTTVTPR